MHDDLCQLKFCAPTNTVLQLKYLCSPCDVLATESHWQLQERHDQGLTSQSVL
jgi:hypothetical protein